MPLLQTPSLDRLGDHPPVILVGMHRSGTSLVSRLLAGMGIHMGYDLDPNAESKHLRSLNKHIMRAAGSEWNTPQNVLDALEVPGFVQNQAAYMRAHVLTGLGAIRYWGPRRWLALRQGGAIPAWGTKDPRTSLTLAIWLDVFPQARVVHIIRNGIDVAISLHRRQLAQAKRWRTHPDHRDPRGRDFRFCFGLWEAYQAHLLTFRETVPAAQYTEIRYEALLREPETTLRHILDRIGAPVDEARLAAAIAMINTWRLDNRAYAAAYQDAIPELAENPLMRALGYPEG
jgi:LPS sulfotransferase NodH